MVGIENYYFIHSSWMSTSLLFSQSEFWKYMYLSRLSRRRQCHPTPVLFPGKSDGRRSLVGCSPGGFGVGHDWATSLSLFTFMHWRRKWQPILVFLLGESQGWGSLVGSHLWGRAESDMTEVTQQQQQQQQLVLVQRIRNQKKECLCKLNFMLMDKEKFKESMVTVIWVTFQLNSKGSSWKPREIWLY